MITVEKDERGTVVCVQGIVTGRNRMFKELSNAPGEKIILDLQKAKRMNCHALGAIVQFQRENREKREIVIVLSSGRIQKLLEQTGISRTVNIVQSVAEAYRSFEILAS
jgi:anti-anti-sigma factor